MKHPFIKAASSMYINYFLLGMVNIILASNMSFLTKQLHTDKAGISYIVAAIGIGKLLTYGLSGWLADRYSRKLVVTSGAAIMIIFLIGIPLTHVYWLAFAFAVVAGIANSALDAGTYPALMESFPKSSGNANVMVKAFISLGAAFLPYMISFIASEDYFYGWSFFVPAIIFAINVFILLSSRFPDHKKVVKELQNINKNKYEKIQPAFKFEGIGLIIIGFTSTALFTTVQVWLPSFGQEVIGMTNNQAVKLLSYYSIGALVSVIILAFVLNRLIKPVTVLVIYPLVTIISLAFMLSFHTTSVVIICSIICGYSIAGVFQLAVTVMSELFWRNKGAITGVVSTAGSIAAIVMPALTGFVSKHGNISTIFVVDGIVAVIGLFVAVFVWFRYRKLFSI